MITHAGSVTYRQSQSETLYLIISSSDGAHWVLPEGHIDPNESPKEPALRELREEAGIVGKIVDKLSIQFFEIPQEKVAVQYFLIEGLQSCQATENRVMRWEVLDMAHELLSFENTRAILLEGSRSLDRQELSIRK